MYDRLYVQLCRHIREAALQDLSRHTHHCWNSALVHSNLWSQWRMPEKSGKSWLNSELGVVSTTRRGRRKPNRAAGTACSTAGSRCSILQRQKRRQSLFLRDAFLSVIRDPQCSVKCISRDIPTYYGVAGGAERNVRFIRAAGLTKELQYPLTSARNAAPAQSEWLFVHHSDREPFLVRPGEPG